jgi:Zn-dependent protease with chaperone function
MNSPHLIGRILLITGVILILAGAIFILLNRLSLFGTLPGDLFITKKNVTIILPLATSLFISIVVTIILNLVLRAR